MCRHRCGSTLGFICRLRPLSSSSRECRSTMRPVPPRTCSSTPISTGPSAVRNGTSDPAGMGRGRSSNQHAFRPRFFKSRSATTEYLLPGGRNGVVMRQRGGSSTMGATGTKRPTNGSGASVRIAGHSTKVKKAKVKKAKAAHRDSPSKDVARRTHLSASSAGRGGADPARIRGPQSSWPRMVHNLLRLGGRLRPGGQQDAGAIAFQRRASSVCRVSCGRQAMFPLMWNPVRRRAFSPGLSFACLSYKVSVGALLPPWRLAPNDSGKRVGARSEIASNTRRSPCNE